MSVLPAGWASAILGDVIDGFQAGRNLQAQGRPAEGDEFGVLKISAVTWGRFSATQNKALLPGDRPFAHETVRASDLLISRANTTELVGAPVLVDRDHPNLMLPDKVLRVLYRASVVDPRYLLHALRSTLARRHIETEATGTSDSMRNLSQPKLREIPFPLAPRREQKRIADKLDALLARVDACRDRLDRVPALLKRFRQAVLVAAMRGDLTSDSRAMRSEEMNGKQLARALQAAHAAAGGHKAGNASEPTEGAHDLTTEDFPIGWGLTTLREAVDPGRPITYGILKPGPELSEGVLYVRVADFPSDRLNLTGIRRTSPEMDAEFKRSRLRAGDILLSIRGTVGRLVSVPPELEQANITQDSARLSIQPTLNAAFVLWYLRSESAQPRMRRAIKGVAVRGINIGDVRALQIPVPSRAEQDEIVRRVESQIALADALEAKLTAARAGVGRLTPALLSKAFRGELVLQDPNDDPASALLARLHANDAGAAAQRSATTKTVRKPRTATKARATA